MKKYIYIILFFSISFFGYSQTQSGCHGICKYLDQDGDGFGFGQLTAPVLGNIYSTNNLDCDDENADINPNTVWYADVDGDGYGSLSSGPTIIQCLQPMGYVLDNTDCDDTDPTINPDTIWYVDNDHDGYGNSNQSIAQCTKPAGYYVQNNLDCDDTNNANTIVRTWAIDTDGDGFGETNSIASCAKPTGGNYVSNNSDLCPGIYGAFQGCTIPNSTTNLSFNANKNYILTISPKVPVSSIQLLADDKDFNSSITYFDGLGSPTQKIDHSASGLGNDMVTHIEYDQFGRQKFDFLPFASTQKSLNYIDSYVLKSNLTTQYQLLYGDTNPYSEKLFEDSPLSRVLKQAAPGNDWALNNTNDHTIKFDYQTNQFQEVRKFKVVFDAGTTENHHLENDGYYDINQLSKTVTKDENWMPADNFNKTTQEFKDKEGRVVLKRKFNNNIPHDTYYVCDIYGNLSYVISPNGSQQIDALLSNSTTTYRNYPWTRLARVDGKLAEQYNKLFSEYKNEFIRDADLFQQYGGQGGFTLTNLGNGVVSLNLNLSVIEDMELNTGSLFHIEGFDDVKDTEIGRIKSEQYDYEYIFSIQNGYFVVQGKGKIHDGIQTTLSSSKLVYSHNYSWAELLDIDPKEAESYIARYKEMNNDLVLTAPLDNPYNASGGLNISVDEFDNVSLNINLNCDNNALKSKLVIPLELERKLENKNLGDITTETAKYQIFIDNNQLVISGEGEISSLNFQVTSSSTSTTITTIPIQIVEGLCYEYHFDHRNRLVEKRIPGKGWEYKVYDKLNRLVMSQDANLRLNNQWLFIKYDVFNRPVVLGRVDYVSSFNTYSDLRREVQQQYDNQTILNESRSNTPYSNGGIAINYTNTTFPTDDGTNNFNVFIVNYFDDYNVAPYGTSLSFPTANNYGTALNTSLKGLATMNLIRILDTNHWKVSLIGYDTMGRLIWAKATNSYLQTQDEVHSNLDFVGKPLQTTSIHNKTGVTTNLTVLDSFTYDQADRLLKHTQKINNQNEELIAFNQYDELGNIIGKKVGNTAPLATATYNTANGLQTIDYTYNIRGWLTSINDINTPLSTSSDLFAFKLNYNNAPIGGTPLYNGNISATTWKSANDNKSRNYLYSYDDLNRLVQANFSSPVTSENYNEGNLTYDRNGNIGSLTRYGLKTDNTIDIIDQLSYTYVNMSNRLSQVADSSIETSGFNDDANTGDDYSYDVNGNLISDSNKDITSITYNHLNLPTKIRIQKLCPTCKFVPQYIDYLYDATGVKVEKKVSTSTNIVTTTQYTEGYVYENNVLQYGSQPEGYFKPSSGNFSYIYQYKDHLGNIRLSYTKNSNNVLEIIEENNFYPFGLKQQGYNNVISPTGNTLAEKKKYNGREWQDELGLNVTAMDFRQYDNALGRFYSIDLLSEYTYDISPYRFALNNPNYWSDPSGLFETRKEARAYRKANHISGGIIRNNDGTFSINDKTNGVIYTKGDDSNNADTHPNDGVVESIVVTTSPKNKQQTDWYTNFGRGNFVFGTGSTVAGWKGFLNSEVMYSQGIRRGLLANYQLTGRNLNLFSKVPMTKTTMPISQLGRWGGIFSRVSFGVGVTADLVGVWNYTQNPKSPNAVHPAKFAVNTTMGAVGVWGGIPGAIVSIVYFGVDNTCGWPAAMEKSAEVQNRDREILGFYPKD